MKNNGILRFLLLNAIFVLLSFNGFGQINITPVRTDVAGFGTWTDASVAGTTYLQLLTATSSTISPSMDFTPYSSITLDFTARTFGGVNATENTITISISTDGGTSWTSLGTRTPTTTTLTSMTQFNLSSYNTFSNVIIRFTVAGTLAGVGAGIDDITIQGVVPSCTAPTTQATSFTSTVGANNINIGWTRGNGNRVLVVAREAGAVNTDPTNGSTYTADANFTSGSQIGTGNYVVYDGVGTSVNVTGLHPGRTYHFAIYEYFTADNCFVLTQLTGNATTLEPDINVLGNGVSIVDGDTSPSSTDLTSFTAVCVASGSVVSTFTIENLGVASLHVSTITITGTNAADFSLSGITFGATIPNPGSTTFSVTFDPSATGTRVATLTITSDDPNETTYNFNIQGIGNASPTISTQPTSTSATPSTSATFAVIATGSLLSYTWQENTGSGWNSISNGGVYSGATTSVLTITNPSLTMTNYAYRATVTNACGNVTTNGLSSLTVTPEPCLNETFSTVGIPAGWVATSTSFTSGLYAEMASNNGEMVTIAVSNPTSLTFDISRTTNATDKTLNILVSTTAQDAGFTTVATYNHSNTTSGGTTNCTVDLSAYTGFSTVYIKFQKVSATTASWRIYDINVFCSSTTPSITASTLSLTSFDYVLGLGPSAVQSLTVGGYSLTTDLILTASTNYQISTSAGGPFSSSISLSPSSGTIASTPIFVQLISGLSVNTYTGSIGLTSTGATSLTVSLSGSVLIATTIFRPGDLVYIGYDCTNGSAEDAIYIMNMVDILPGTSFAHVNSRFESGAAACTRTMHWGGPGDDPDADPAILNIQLKATASTIPAGSVIRIETNTTGADVISINNGANVVTNFNLYTTGGPPNISSSEPDQLYLVQGTFTGLGTNNVQLNGQVLYGLTNGADWVPFNSAVSNGSTGGATRVSRLHPDLECFNFLNLTQLDIAYYKTTEVHIGSKRTLLGSIGNVANWTTSTTASSIPVSVSTTTFTISGGNLPGYWVGDAPTNKTDWFTCGNWEGLVVPDNLLDVVIPTSASTFSRIDVDGYALTGCAGSFTSDKYLVGGVRMAVCKSLTIDGKTLEFGNGAANSGAIADRLDIFGDLTINNTAGGSIDMDAGTSVQDGTINLQGNWTNNHSEAAFVQGNGTINFVQSLNQTVNTNSFNEVFANIGVNKTGGAVTLNYTSEVEQVASYTSGLINSTLTNLLIFRDGATAVGASNASFTNGPVRKIGNDAFIFPIGKTSVYAPAGITAPGVITDHFTAEYFDVNPHPTYDNTLLDVTIDHISTCEHWIINRTNGTSNVSVDLSWNTPRSCGVTTLADLLVARWDGLLWRDHGNGGTTGNTTTGTIVTSGVVTSFSPFTLGSVSILNPLPIVVNKFEAVKNGANVDLSWSVSNNNKINYFEIWTSTDGESFELNESVKASNKFLASKDYFTIDNNPQIGVNYYKLKIVDANGAITFSDIRSVNFDLNNSIYIFPNPVELGKDVYVNLQLIDENEIVEVSIIDQIGKAVLNQAYTGQKSIYINTLQLAKGVYFVKVKSKNELVSQRIIVI